MLLHSFLAAVLGAGFSINPVPATTTFLPELLGNEFPNSNIEALQSDVSCVSLKQSSEVEVCVTRSREVGYSVFLTFNQEQNTKNIELFLSLLANHGKVCMGVPQNQAAFMAGYIGKMLNSIAVPAAVDQVKFNKGLGYITTQVQNKEMGLAPATLGVEVVEINLGQGVSLKPVSRYMVQFPDCKQLQ